jgi:hypothetical protein
LNGWSYYDKFRDRGEIALPELIELHFTATGPLPTLHKLPSLRFLKLSTVENNTLEPEVVIDLHLPNLREIDGTVSCRKFSCTCPKLKKVSL